MRFFCTYIIISLLGSGAVTGQTPIDSLESVLKKDLPDSTRIAVLINLSREFQYTNINRSREHAEQALKFAEVRNIRKEKVRAYQNLGALYAISGDYSSALRYDNLALQSSLESRDSLNLSMDYNNVASDYYDLGEYDEAYFYFTQSYRVARAVDDSLRMAIALHNVGRVFKELGQYDRALAHLELSMEMSRRVGDVEGIPYSLDEIGDVLIRKGEYDSALEVLHSSLNKTRTQKVHVLEPKTLSKLATVHLHAGDYKNALAYYDTTYNLHERTGNEFGIAEVELGRSLVYIEQGKYDLTEQSVNKSLALAKQSNARILEIRGYHTLSNLYELKKDHKNALAYFKQFKELEDSLFSQDMQEKLLRDQIRFETEEKDTEIAALNQERSLKDDTIKKQEFVRNILVVVMALSVILLATVYRSGQRRRQINTL
ncbi:MAG TPA: tetratricopeptide repeat protein, partial [Chryseosolibacter sp.]|nr:tetratricopeptide repeat protein [Chryseosolibacter sp.]